MSDYYEKDIEDWICENIATVVGHDDAVFFDRQVRLVSGKVMDVLAVIPGDQIRPVIIEVKRDKIDTSAVVQLLEYMGRVAGAHEDWWMTTHVYGGHSRPTEMARPWGILAAPDITEAAAMCVNGVAELEYVRTTIRFSAVREAMWDTVDVPYEDGDLYELMYGVAHQADGSTGGR